MKAKRLLALVLAAAMVFALAGCVDQHPDMQEDTDADTENPRLVATSPAVAQICNRLELDLVGVCQTSGTLPERYQDLPKVGLAMNPDLEILKSLEPDYILSPNSLESDLQPKYASIGVKSLFLNLKSVDGMFQILGKTRMLHQGAFQSIRQLLIQIRIHIHGIRSYYVLYFITLRRTCRELVHPQFLMEDTICPLYRIRRNRGTVTHDSRPCERY